MTHAEFLKERAQQAADDKWYYVAGFDRWLLISKYGPEAIATATNHEIEGLADLCWERAMDNLLEGLLDDTAHAYQYIQDWQERAARQWCSPMSYGGYRV